MQKFLWGWGWGSGQDTLQPVKLSDTFLYFYTTESTYLAQLNMLGIWKVWEQEVA